MARYLVTFCNGETTRLAVIGAHGIERTVELDLSKLGRPIVGLTGITFHRSQCLVAVQCTPSVMVALGPDFTVEETYAFDDVYGLHGIASHGEEVVLVSTLTNQVMAFDPRTRALRVIWGSSDSLSDTIHLNDVAVQGDAVYCCCFGARLPHAMRNGQIFDATSGARIATHLREPHSIVARDGKFFALESATGDLLSLRHGFMPRRICGIVGYARGLAMDDTHYFVGKSGYRSMSRDRLGDSRLAPLAHSDGVAEMMRRSGVFVIDRASLTFDFVDTTHLGHEIYQILEIPPAFDAQHGRAAG